MSTATAKENKLVPASRRAASGVQAVTIRRQATHTGIVNAASRGAGAPAKSNVNGLLIVHQAMRGRYLLAAFLGLLAGTLCGLAGWRLSKPTYTSESLVRIAYRLPVVVRQTDQNEPMGQMFDTFMQSQRLLLSSRRIIDIAIQDPVWRATGRQVPPNPDLYFASNMKVEVRPRSEFILISVTDPDPGTAAAAVTAVVNAYAEMYNSQEKQLERQRIGWLEDRQNFLQAKVDELSTQVNSRAAKYGTTTPTPIYDAAVARVTQLDTTIMQLRVALSTASAAPARPQTQPAAGGLAAAAPEPQPQQPAAMTVEQIASADQSMRIYLAEQERLENEMARLDSLKYGASHPSVVTTRTALEAARVRVQRCADAYNAIRAAAPVIAAAAPVNLAAPNNAGADGTGGANGNAAAAAIPLAGRSAEALRANEAILVQMQKDAKAEMLAIGADMMSLRQLEGEQRVFQTELAELKKRAEELRSEGTLGGRLSIVSTGEIPISPARDSRMKLAGAAGVAGAAVPVGALFLLGLMRRRYRYADEAESAAPTVSLLGILPMLKPDQAGSEDWTAAAQSLHQIRVTLRARAAGEGAAVYMVTSATAGEGKTSLTMALGLSFAASGQRALVVDADLVGRHLTRSLKATELEGMHEAMSAGTLRRHVRKAGEGLYVLTAGRASAADASRLSASGVRSLLAEARRHFDVVLVDTGPILGSVEAAVLAQEVDSVIFAMTSGQQHGLVQRAVARLQSLGAQLEGFVFNRARPADFRHASCSSSLRSAPGPDLVLEDAASSAKHKPFASFGPLVQAVAATPR